MPEKRKFTVHPDIIFNLIQAQAGTLGKAVLECIMNSIDAGATHCDIELESERLRITDDGQGFRSRKEIEDWFEVFGFPHEIGEANRRVYGQFGIGRAQLWSFASTVWETATFRMDVDIKRRGLDYHLQEDRSPAVKGVRIEGRFYERLRPSELMELEKELSELAYYAQIPVSFNGKAINHDPRGEKWDFTTEDAWIRVKDSGELKVYNLGVLVRRYPGYGTGCGGVVVTKPEVRLKLNMARNDILVSECGVWKRIKPFLQKKCDERMREKQTRLSEAELENTAKRLLAGELTTREVEKIRLVTDINGRGYTLEQFLRRPEPVATAGRGSRIAERVHQARAAFVLAPVTLERFEAETPSRLKAKLLRVLKRDREGFERQLQDRVFVDDMAEVAHVFKDGHDVIPESQWTKQERAALQALSMHQYRLVAAMIAAGSLPEHARARRLRLGVSDTAEMWTDGRCSVWVERDTLKVMKQGISGVQAIVNVLAHEYLHDQADMGSHQHDTEFLERYHELTCSREHGMLGEVVPCVFRSYVAKLHALGCPLNGHMLRELDDAEAVHTEEPAHSRQPEQRSAKPTSRQIELMG